MRDSEFKAWLQRKYPNPNTWNTYLTETRRIVKYKGNLDEHYAKDGLKSLLDLFYYSKKDGIMPKDDIPHQADPYTTASFRRQCIKLYREFCGSSSEETAGTDQSEKLIEPKSAPVQELGFRLERDLQEALRANIGQLESGLRIADGGAEKITEIGNIDITALDEAGNMVIIELKAGTAGPDVVGQILAYMGAVAEEESAKVRGIVVAKDFHARTRMAAKSVPNLALKRYSFRFSFEDV